MQTKKRQPRGDTPTQKGKQTQTDTSQPLLHNTALAAAVAALEAASAAAVTAAAPAVAGDTAAGPAAAAPAEGAAAARAAAVKVAAAGAGFSLLQRFVRGEFFCVARIAQVVSFLSLLLEITFVVYLLFEADIVVY